MIDEVFEETNLAAVGLNRAREVWDEEKLISKFRDGRHGTEWVAYRKSEQVTIESRLALAWRAAGLAPGDRVAIFGGNRPRWAFTFNSLLSAQLVTVPIYPTLTGEEAAYILENSGARYVVVDTLDQVKKLKRELPNLPQLEGVVVMEAVEGALPEKCVSFDDWLAKGGKQPDWAALAEMVRAMGPEDLAAIIYTSGTTGKPKGVMLSHGNFLSQRPLQKSFDLSPDDIFLNHLPFCHVFGLTADLFGSIAINATLVIADGIEPDKIRHALTTIRPTVLMSVPRLFEKIFVQVRQVAAQKPEAVQKLIAGALELGKQVFDLECEGTPIPLGLRIKHRFAQRITGKVLRQAGLDRVRLAYAGGAPTSKELCHFYQGLGIQLYQGYGLTETSPVATVNLPGKNRLGTVGLPISGVEVDIAEDGEILIRGENVMQGYFNNPEATRDAIDEAGWFRTGDIGEIDQDGFLKIVDRKKELIVTSGGKNIAPLSIESAFNTDPFIERVVVIGEQRNYLTALVVPEFDALREWAHEEGHLISESNSSLAEDKQVGGFLEYRVSLVNRHLARYEQIKKIHVLDHGLNVDDGTLTPTEKLRRKVIDEKYAAEIEEMYAREGNIGAADDGDSDP